jgi:hypothetical protein
LKNQQAGSLLYLFGGGFLDVQSLSRFIESLLVIIPFSRLYREAQSEAATASIVGDQQGGAIADAPIMVREVTTNPVREAVSSADGSFLTCCRRPTIARRLRPDIFSASSDSHSDS